ncbi:unnamed protein product, partial [Dicrocoelium dendriticum]
MGLARRLYVKFERKCKDYLSLSPEESGKCGCRTALDDSLVLTECQKNRKASSKQLQRMIEQHGVAEKTGHHSK